MLKGMLKAEKLSNFFMSFHNISISTVHLCFLLRHGYKDDEDINGGWEQIHT